MSYIPEGTFVSGGASDPLVGELLFEWNREDVSQFETTALTHERDIGSPAGGNANTALVLSVVDLGGVLGKVLRMTATSLAGGGIFEIKSSELTLPVRYVVVTKLTEGTTTGFPAIDGGVYIFFHDDAPDFNGIVVSRKFGVSSMDTVAIVNDRTGSAETMAGAGTLDAATVSKGGISQIITVDRQEGSTPANALVTVEERGPDDGFQFDGSLPIAITGVGTNWDALDMNRIGIGALEGANNTSASFDIAELRVYAHPED